VFVLWLQSFPGWVSNSTLCVERKIIYILHMHGGYTWGRNWWWVGCCCTPPLCQFLSNMEHQIRGRCLRKLVILSDDVIVHTWIISREVTVISFSWCCSWVFGLVTKIHFLLHTLIRIAQQLYVWMCVFSSPEAFANPKSKVFGL
jgi:hypothetical protein